MALIQSTAIPSGATDYELEQSLRFNDDDSAYLSWTPASAGNRTTWTWSGWIKLGSAGDGWHMIFSAGDSSGGGATGEKLTGLLLYNDTLYIYWDAAAGGTNPAMKLRDPSAWYHVCLVATSSSLACYINGTLVGTKSGSGNGAINNTLRHGIGVRGDSLTSNFDGYMSEIHFIDGTAVAATSFGETGDYGEWKPIEYEGTYGTNGFYLNFAGGGIMSATGGTITTDGDYKIHTFTSSGTFTPTSIDGGGWVEYLVVGGGGAGGANVGGGGGGGASTTSSFVPADTPYTITVGTGGAGASGYDQAGANGIASSIAGSGLTTITADYGNGGITVADGYINTGQYAGGDGGTSGGGRGGDTPSSIGNTNNTVGANGTANSLSGSSITYGSGGGGGGWDSAAKAGGTNSTTANSGGGGAGASGSNVAGSAGQAGVVIIKYKFQ